MALFEKIAKFFKKPAFEAPSAPKEVSISVPLVARPAPRPIVSAAPARPEAEPAVPPRSAKELFLEELRSIPVLHSSIEAARADMMKELKRITPDQDRLS